MNTKKWRTSSYTGNENNCVEVATASNETDVRDTKNRHGGTLQFDTAAFAAFLASLKADGSSSPS